MRRRSAGSRTRGRRPARRGFTLIEVLVALAVTGLVLVGAHRLIEGMTASARTLTDAAAAADERANAERLLRGLVASLEVGTTEAHEFGGTEREVRFTSWCDVPAGWQERCDVRVAIDTVDGALALTAATWPTSAGAVYDAAPGASRRIVLRRGLTRGALRYLNRPDAGGTWFLGWGRGITVPLAIGVILVDSARADTLILRIGERG